MRAAPAEYETYRHDVAGIRPEQALRRRLYFDFHHGILPWILHLKDASAMAHGIEIRSPFLDWRVVCFALSLPGPSVVGNGFTKRLLREAMVGRLPDDIRTRTSKVSFVDSEGSLFWRMKPVVLETVSGNSFRDSPLWEGARLRQEIEKAYEVGGSEKCAFFWKCVKTARLMAAFGAGSEGRARSA
jgi:asparagine synthase (glutamine-hydrolysing)